MRDICFLGFSSLALAVLAGCSQPAAIASVSSLEPVPTVAAVDRRADCSLIDSDAGLDDLRAITVLAPHRRIAAVVVTEGLATPRGGARALRTFLRGAGIPVVEGTSPAPDREFDADRFRGLDTWRVTAETLNGTLPPPSPVVRVSEEVVPPVEAKVERLTAGCARLALLAIGPWTSFLRYESVVGRRLVQLVAQGSPFPDDEARGEPDGWNCGTIGLPAARPLQCSARGDCVPTGSTFRRDLEVAAQLSQRKTSQTREVTHSRQMRT